MKHKCINLIIYIIIYSNTIAQSTFQKEIFYQKKLNTFTYNLNSAGYFHRNLITCSIVNSWKEILLIKFDTCQNIEWANKISFQNKIIRDQVIKFFEGSDQIWLFTSLRDVKDSPGFSSVGLTILDANGKILFKREFCQKKYLDLEFFKVSNVKNGIVFTAGGYDGSYPKGHYLISLNENGKLKWSLKTRYLIRFDGVKITSKNHIKAIGLSNDSLIRNFTFDSAGNFLPAFSKSYYNSGPFGFSNGYIRCVLEELNPDLFFYLTSFAFFKTNAKGEILDSWSFDNFLPFLYSRIGDDFVFGRNNKILAVDKYGILKKGKIIPTVDYFNLGTSSGDNNYIPVIGGSFDKGNLQIINLDGKLKGSCIGRPFPQDINNIYLDTVTDSVMSDLKVVKGSIYETKELIVYSKFVTSEIRQKYICASFEPAAVLPFDTVLCTGDTLRLQAGNPNSEYLWSSGDSSNELEVTKPGIYWVRVTYGGCVSSDTIKVDFLNEEQFSLGSDKKICEGDSIYLDPPIKDIPENKYFWKLPNGSMLFTKSIYGKTEGTYQLLVKQKGICGVFDSINISFQKMPQPEAGPDTVLCWGSSIQLKGKGGISYTWLPPDDLNDAFIANPVATPTTTTKYLLITKNEFGCSDTDSVWLNVYTPLTAQSEKEEYSFCPGDSVKISLKEIIGGKPGNKYQVKWFPENDTVTHITYYFKGGPGYRFPYYLRYSVSDNCSKVFIDSIKLGLNKIPEAELMVNPLKGCIPIKLSFDAHKENTQIMGYHWKISDGEDSIIVSGNSFDHIFKKAGKYTVSLSLESNTGCKNLISYPVPLFLEDPPKSDFYVKPIETSLDDPLIFFNNISRNATNYKWYFTSIDSSSAVNPSFRYNDTGTYFPVLIAFNDINCTDTSSGIVRINDVFNLYMPNAFSPGDDQYNNTFGPSGRGISKFELLIFNRWGEIIFNGKESWNGKKKEVYVEPGNYLYVLKVISFNNQEFHYKGIIRVIR